MPHDRDLRVEFRFAALYLDGLVIGPRAAISLPKYPASAARMNGCYHKFQGFSSTDCQQIQPFF
jgi:hypothetical protein